ncbi:MAG: hypothetical protein F7C32_03450 [Desulfurococcales archaeon]|nr:hypothetical protein [Desulfurococcales archaeon]
MSINASQESGEGKLWEKLLSVLEWADFSLIDDTYHLLYRIVKHPEELVPRYDPETDSYISPLMEHFKKYFKDASEFQARMNLITGFLLNHGALKSTVYTRRIECPRVNEHGPSRMITEYHCIFCGSFNLEKVRVIQHVTCGFTGIESQFKKDPATGMLVCPYCNVPLLRKNEDYRILKHAYQCMDCRKINMVPKIVHRCSKCGGVYDYRDVLYTPIYRFKQGPYAERLYMGKELILLGLKRYFTEKNYKVKENVKVRGLTLVEYKVDLLIAKTRRRWINVDILDSMPGFAFKAKLSSANPLTYRIVLSPAINVDVFLKEYPGAEKISFQVKERISEAAKWLEQSLGED